MQIPSRYIPYGRHCIDDDDINSVIEVLKSDWLTTGPYVEKFENSVASYVGAKHAVGVSSGTAALHTAAYVAGIGPGDEVIVPAITFVATANCVAYQGGTPVIVDVEPDTLCIDPKAVEAHITSRTKAIISVDYAGHPCDYDVLRAIAKRHNLILIADACHSLGAAYKGRSVGTLADLNVFSFHPVKHITTGEGGMITTDDECLARRMRQFRNHGISKDHRQRTQEGTWFYEMTELGFNYRITDFQCALGMSQLKKLPVWVKRRREIAAAYDEMLLDCPTVKPLKVKEDVDHSYHLYVVRCGLNGSPLGRDELFNRMRKQGIGVNVHYYPVHLHAYYRQNYATRVGQCPEAEKAYTTMLTLPLFHSMDSSMVDDVCRVVKAAESKCVVASLRR